MIKIFCVIILKSLPHKVKWKLIFIEHIFMKILILSRVKKYFLVFKNKTYHITSEIDVSIL